MPLNIDGSISLYNTLNVDKDSSSIVNIFNKILGRGKSLDDNRKFENSVFDLVPDGIIVANLSGFVIAVNKAYYTLTGYSKDQIVGKHLMQLPSVQFDDNFEYWNVMKSVFMGEDIQGFEFKYRHADGSIRWGEARARIAKKGIFSGEAIAVLREITGRKQKDEELKIALDELARSNRELDDYTYAVSHDLKSPLRTIGSFSNFLLEDYSVKLDDQGKEYLSRMQAATQRMTELIDDLLKISRVGRMDTNLELVGINEIINEIISDNKVLLDDKNGKIVAGELPSINSQKIWIKQLFANLVNNGLKLNKSSNPTVWIECEEKEDHYLFSVGDNGIGIEKKHQEKIFKIFQRLHTTEEYPGTGAGLHICKKIVESWGGEIRVESKVGKGTTFFLTILKNVSLSEPETNIPLYDTSPVPESTLLQE
jgi:PAS domain S-box-containing protein